MQPRIRTTKVVLRKTNDCKCCSTGLTYMLWNFYYLTQLNVIWYTEEEEKESKGNIIMVCNQVFQSFEIHKKERYAQIL